ncbi:hypothetical protein E3J74_02070 [Candidatus Bathyarchaeota archaeon]|nr:MAG: hypothetical protein E3J74_02070 [Candidatus Bathyarchaeota archaeon]
MISADHTKAVVLTSVIFISVLAVYYPYNHQRLGRVSDSGLFDYPQIELNQTADMTVVFLGIASEYIDENEFKSNIKKNAAQFASSNTITWNLNVSIIFHDFPESIMDALASNAYQHDGNTYYNVTLLDTLLSGLESLAVPKRGYLTVFMWLPDGSVNHSWFYILERLDLFLGRTDYFNGKPFKYWAFPSYFGGIRRALYFDLSDVIERTPVKTVITNNAIRLFNNGLEDVFVNSLGATLLNSWGDSRMIEADMQRYERYELRILWLNGTGEQIYRERIKEAFEDLMPWTNWTITVKTRPVDAELNSFVENRTVELPKPLTYSFSLSDGSKITIQTRRSVMWDVWGNHSGENDPLTQYFFERVKDYFNLTDIHDKSVIPLVFLQLRNDTGAAGGMSAGVSWFPCNMIIICYQGAAVNTLGAIFMTQLIRHEVGHWVSLSHHSERFGLGYAKSVCSMRALTNRFCAFCKDARRRISFISYYNATTELLSNSSELPSIYGNRARVKALENELEDSLQHFNDWEYVEAVQSIVRTYHQTEDIIQEAKNLQFVYTYILPVLIIAVAASSIIITFAWIKKRKTKVETSK